MLACVRKKQKSKSCFFSFSFSCIEFPDCRGGDGPERRAVSSEWQLWLRPEAQFIERAQEKIWPWDTPKTGWLSTCRPHHTGTNHKEVRKNVSLQVIIYFNDFFYWGHCIYVFQVISGQQLPKVNIKEDSIVDPLVRVEIHGVPVDQAKQETRYIENNGTAVAVGPYTYPCRNKYSRDWMNGQDG